MPHIVVLSASVRTGRASHRVALFFKRFTEAKNLATADIVDLYEYQFPLFNERLRYQKNITPQVADFTDKIKKSNGVIIVTPEYNGGYPASLKNVIDLLYQEWFRKPIGIVTVSDGNFGGAQVLTSLQFSLWKIKAWVIPAMFPVPKIKDAFDERGYPADEVATERRATAFMNELLWCIEAKRRMETPDIHAH